MSILIKGMKMLKDGDVLTVKKDVDGKIYIKQSYMMGYSAELIELPAEHGRLGDLDAMAFDESEAYMSAQAKLGRDVITTGINSIVHRKIQLLIMDTPTIIEAEEVQDGTL